MTTLWVAIVAVALADAVIKAAGPLLAGGRELPPRVVAVVALLGPAPLAALVVIETFAEDRRLVIDEQAIGVAVAGLVLALRGPVLSAVAPLRSSTRVPPLAPPLRSRLDQRTA